MTVRNVCLFLFVAAFATPHLARCEDRQSRPAEAGPRTVYRNDSVELVGLSAAQQRALAGAAWDDAKWRDLLAVYVGENPHPDTPAVLGRYRFENGRVIFTPRFPLRAGVDYTIRWSPGILDKAQNAAQVFSEKLRIKAEASPPTRVAHVYPSRSVLPENQLKFYFYFSAPMSRGDSYQHVRLIQEDGTPVDLPFLELEQELWDDTGTRFTLLFDPGRIKRGLKPREDVGPSLVEGKTYALVIRKDWRDAKGKPLEQDFIKPFRVAAPDDVQPDPKRWLVTAPVGGSRKPLAIGFDEPLDFAMLKRVIGVRDQNNRPVDGQVEVDQQETRWRFRPDAPWRAGKYKIVVETTLEDLAANSIGRPFEVDIFNKVDRSIQVDTVTLSFEVRGE